MECDFLLVINCNFSRICYRFRDIQAYRWKTADFTHSSLVLEASARGEPLEFCDEIWHQKTRIVGLPDSEEIMALAFFVLT